MISKWTNGKVCVCHSGGIVLVNETLASATEKLQALGVIDPSAILDTKVPDHIWRSTFLAGCSAQLAAQDEILQNVAQHADVAAVVDTQQELKQGLQILRDAITEDRLRAELRDCEAWLEKEHARCMAIVAKDWPERDHAAFSAGTWNRLMASPTGLRTIELRETL